MCLKADNIQNETHILLRIKATSLMTSPFWSSLFQVPKLESLEVTLILLIHCRPPPPLLTGSVYISASHPTITVREAGFCLWLSLHQCITRNHNCERGRLLSLPLPGLVVKVAILGLGFLICKNKGVEMGPLRTLLIQHIFQYPDSVQGTIILCILISHIINFGIFSLVKVVEENKKEKSPVTGSHP